MDGAEIKGQLFDFWMTFAGSAFLAETEDTAGLLMELVQKVTSGPDHPFRSHIFRDQFDQNVGVQPVAQSNP
jgi:hypothetical protein